MQLVNKQFSVLIIEDNPGDYVLLEDYLCDQVVNPIIKHATSFKEAKEFLTHNTSFDVIFLDLTLPDASGKQLVNDILEIAGEMPIIALTGYEDKEFSIKTLSLGISDYLFKDELNPSLLHKSIVYNIERKRITKELKESEKKYRNLFHVSPIPMWVFDPETLLFLNANDAAIKHYGYSNEEFLSMTIKQIRPSYEIDKIENIVRSQKNSELFTGIFTHKKKDGSLIKAEIKSNKINFNGKVAKLIIAIDVTEKLKAEESLKLSEQLFKALVQDGADLISILDLEGNYTFVSPSASSIIGVDAKALIGKNAFDFIHEDDRQRVVNQYNLLRRKKRVQISPFRFKNANNNWIWLETIATNMMDDPAVNGIISNSRDITLNINYNQKLKQNFERYESLAKATSDAIWDHDFEIERTYIAGDGYKNLFGYNIANQFSEENFWESRLHPDEKENTIQFLANVINDPNIIQSKLEYRFLKADGTYAYVHDRFFIIRENGKPLRMLGAKQDVTRQRIEEQEKEKLITELIQTNKDLKQFSYITSHNLRGPIANLLGLSSLLDHYDIKDETLKQIFAGIKKATFMFDDIIKDLTKVLNIKDHISIPQEDLNILAALEKGIDQNETMINETGAKIITDFTKTSTLKFNKAYLESIFFNLISNAIKYRSPARNLKILISSEIIDNEVVLKFNDNGLGLDVELYKERLFRLYQRFHDHAEGKGLGLFLVKSQMEALNGSIDLESKVGTGTTFILKFKQ